MARVNERIDSIEQNVAKLTKRVTTLTRRVARAEKGTQSEIDQEVVMDELKKLKNTMLVFIGEIGENKGAINSIMSIKSPIKKMEELTDRVNGLGAKVGGLLGKLDPEKLALDQVAEIKAEQKKLRGMIQGTHENIDKTMIEFWERITKRLEMYDATIQERLMAVIDRIDMVDVIQKGFNNILVERIGEQGKESTDTNPCDCGHPECVEPKESEPQLQNDESDMCVCGHEHDVHSPTSGACWRECDCESFHPAEEHESNQP